ncbi:MAG: T9SS type A sorting domain-containing protein [Flavobacteriales bacterium]
MIARPLAIALFSSSVIAGFGQQIANGNFEAWTNVVAYENIDDWNNGNYQAPGIVTTTKVAGHSGQFAAHLETLDIGTDTTFGFILHGNFVNDVAVEGVPFNTDIDAFEGWYRYDLMPNDSALIYLLIWHGGVLVDTVVHLVGGTQLQWTAFNFLVNGGVPVQSDSVIMAVTSSNPFSLTGMTPGSWIEVDGVQLTSNNVPTPDLLPNYDMEDWTDVGSEEPDNWYTFNPYLLQLGLVPITKSTMAHAGSFSVRMETLDLGGDTLPGVLFNSDIFTTGLFTGIPYTDTPNLMTAFYQYAPVGADTAGVGALFISNGAVLTQAYLTITATTSNWTFAGAPITLFNSPDTLILQVYSGNNPGSVLYLDDLMFSGLSMGIHAATASCITVFPQPANDVLNVSTGSAEWIGATARIMDQLGRAVLEEPMGTGLTTSLSLNGLAAGQYVLEMHSGSHSERLVFVKE